MFLRKIKYLALLLAAVFLLVAGLVSCFSKPVNLNVGRVPQSVVDRFENYVASDAFSNIGYNIYDNRTFISGTTPPQEQKIKEMAGREIWFKSAPNERFHAYIFSQKYNSPINFFQILNSQARTERFSRWGLINDPDCCTPGQDCESRGVRLNNQVITLQDTYGFDFCPGDETLLNYVGRSDLKYNDVDPACENPVLEAADQLDSKPREKRCELAFGVSTGAIGWRKFPNPRFNKIKWEKYNRLMATKKGINWDGASWDIYSEDRIKDESIEPPFRMAMACALCHGSYDPTNPPKDVNHATWANIKGEIGNQYINVSAMLSTGSDPTQIEHQMFVHARPGTVDTSAIPDDFVNNPGTMNAIINFSQRPKFNETINRWRNVESCDEGPSCQKITYESGQNKYWEKSIQIEPVQHILKGGEDSVGIDLAIQRVYVNIGMCAEQCWVNHLSNLRELDPAQRGFGQTPFDIAQCRADCASFRANEDRVGDLISYLISRPPHDYKQALQTTDAQFKDLIERKYGSGSLQLGQQTFAKNCAQCHSSQESAKVDLTATTDDFTLTDFSHKKVLETNEIIRTDWMGNDKSTAQTLVGTYQCRALHSNHMQGHVWEQFASETYHAKPSVLQNKRGLAISGGPGYYRNVSLLNVWAYAPFLHNNSVGPEICGEPTNKNYEWYRSPYKNEGPKTSCDIKYDPSVETRVAIYDASMDQLLTHQSQRRVKVMTTDQKIIFPIVQIPLPLFEHPIEINLEFPKGFDISIMGSFAIKDFVKDFTNCLSTYDNDSQFLQCWQNQISDLAAAQEIALAAKGTIQEALAPFQANPLKVIGVFNTLDKLKAGDDARLNTYLKYYSNCSDSWDNRGHNFGTALSQKEKNSLKAFLLTL